MAKSTKPNVAKKSTPQKKTAKKNENVKAVFTPLSDEQLEHFKLKLLALKAEQEEAALTACRVALMDVDDVDHANIDIADISALYNKYHRHFDRYEKTTVEYYINVFCKKLSDANQRILHKTYGMCLLTNGNISIDRLEKYPLATESVVNGEKPKPDTTPAQRLPEVPVNRDGTYDPRHLRQAIV